VFTRRYYPRFLPSVLAATGLSALQRLLIGRLKNGGAILRGMLASFSYAQFRKQRKAAPVKV
jgi:hypothetical protein